MLTNLDPASERFLADLNRIQNTITRATEQATSGKKITVASDAPDEVEALLQLRANQRHNTQLQSNLGLASTEAASADSAIGSAIKLMDRALTLATQGADAAQTAETRESLAAEIEAIQQQMVAYTRTAVQGRYIFSGDQSDIPAYEFADGSPNGVNQLSSSSATRLVEDAGGGTFAASRTAQDIFDHRNADGSYASDNVFYALNTVRLALLANNPEGVTTAVGMVEQASQGLNSAQAFYGAVENRIQNAVDFASRLGVELKTEISQKEDADIPAAAMEQTRANVQLQAAFTMRGKMPSSSLFNYLG